MTTLYCLAAWLLVTSSCLTSARSLETQSNLIEQLNEIDESIDILNDDKKEPEEPKETNIKDRAEELSNLKKTMGQDDRSVKHEPMSKFNESRDDCKNKFTGAESSGETACTKCYDMISVESTIADDELVFRFWACVALKPYKIKGCVEKCIQANNRTAIVGCVQNCGWK